MKGIMTALPLMMSPMQYPAQPPQLPCRPHLARGETALRVVLLSLCQVSKGLNHGISGG
jgi:hypothetical protein